MKKIIFILIFALSINSIYKLYPQNSELINEKNDSSVINDDIIQFIDADKMPKFNYEGGFSKYFYSKLKWPMNGQLDAEGTVLLSFVVNKNGYAEDIKIEKSLCEPSDEEAVKVFSEMQKWEPCEKNSKTVGVKLYFPVKFITYSPYTNRDSLNKLEKPILSIDADKIPKLKYDGGFSNYIYSRLKKPLPNEKSKTLIISFVVNKNGETEKVRVEKGTNIVCEQVPIDLFDNMPLWEPGEKNSKKVDVKMIVQIVYKCDQIFY